jgi:hypothetical protein
MFERKTKLFWSFFIIKESFILANFRHQNVSGCGCPYLGSLGLNLQIRFFSICVTLPKEPRYCEQPLSEATVCIKTVNCDQ